MSRSTNRHVEPEVWFRVVHAAQDGHKGTPVAYQREKMLEISLGPKGAFEGGNIRALPRWVPPDVIARITPPRDNSRLHKKPRTPRVVELLRKALEWRILLESGRIANQAEIARREGVTPARVTQVMGMLRLAWKIRESEGSLRAPGWA